MRRVFLLSPVTLRCEPVFRASHRKSAVADLRTNDLISGKPEISGRRPPPLPLAPRAAISGPSPFEAREDAGTSG
jgi:hypothetical protein